MDAMGARTEVTHLPARNEVTVAYSDHSKFRQVFTSAEKASTPLEEGLRRMAAWAKDVGVRRSTTFEGIEISKNMPPSWRDVLSDTEAG